MSLVYSTCEAKARFSEVIRHVRDGKTVTVSYRGEPVAEIRAIPREPRTIEARLEELERRGVVALPVPSEWPKTPLAALGRRTGALKRFLDERNE